MEDGSAHQAGSAESAAGRSSALNPDVDSRASRSGRGCLWGLGCGIVAVCLLLVLDGLIYWLFPPLSAATSLIFGWLFFLGRATSRMQFDSDQWLIGLAACAGLVIGIHIVARRYLQQISQNSTAGALLHNPWTWRRSVQVVLGVCTLFAAGICLVGIVHESIWLARSPEPWFDVSFEAAGRTMSSANLKFQGRGVLACQEQHSALPSGAIAAADGRLLHGWQTQLLPYLDEVALAEKISLDLPWDDPANRAAFRTSLDQFVAPYHTRKVPAADADGWALTTYAANQHVLGGTAHHERSFISDGESNTLLAGEIVEQLPPWGRPGNWRDPQLGINQDPAGFGGGWSSPRANFLFVDGHISSISGKIDPAVLKALSTPQGGEQVGDF